MSCNTCYWRVRCWVGEDGVGKVELCSCPRLPDGRFRAACPHYVTVRDMALKLPKSWVQ